MVRLDKRRWLPAHVVDDGSMVGSPTGTLGDGRNRIGGLDRRAWLGQAATTAAGVAMAATTIGGATEETKTVAEAEGSRLADASGSVAKAEGSADASIVAGADESELATATGETWETHFKGL